MTIKVQVTHDDSHGIVEVLTLLGGTAATPMKYATLQPKESCVVYVYRGQEVIVKEKID